MPSTTSPTAQPIGRILSGMASLPDIGTLRADTAGCEQRIFLNNAGASLQPRPVVERVIAHLRREEEIGAYEANDEANEEHDQIYSSIATLLNAQQQEIALMESATRAWDMAFYAFPWHAGDVILTTANEYASNYIAFLQVAQRFGVRVVVVPSDTTGAIDLQALEQALQREPQVRLIALTHVPTNNGRIQPAAEVGRLARQFGVAYLLDACQSAGQLPLDVEELGCDLLSATGRKYLRGPRGAGFLYVRRSLLPQLTPPLLDMHAATWKSPGEFVMRDDARRFEAWESSIACRLGLGVAVRYTLELGLPPIHVRVAALADRLRQGLASVPGVAVQDLGWRDGAAQCGIVTFTHERVGVADFVARMAAQSIVVRLNERSATLLDMEARGLDAVARASVHYYNTEDELDRFVEAVKWL
jgi:cysteine desulfurase/selenocysteine lyase